jgi:crotonobetainyl-CoA:carnitine CoA-transferase CaiB-like acyl-CoA transferase
MMTASDLNGITVVTIEQAVAAPYASGKLADAGARVIKIERPEGDFGRGYDKDAKGSSSYFVWLNRGKESVALNLKDSDDLALVKSMIGQADIFIQNLMPGAVARLGLDIHDLRTEYPALITCSISGYGETGPFSQMKAYDLLVQAEVGLANLTGSAEAAGRVGVSICDIGAGMTAYQAILQALIGRATTGKGRHIEVSLFHALADWMNVPYIQSRHGGRTLSRPGLHHPTIAPYGVYTCGDGGMILFSIQNEREWVKFCTDVLGDADMAKEDQFAGNTNRVTNRAALDARIIAVFAKHSRDDMAHIMTEADIAFGRLSDMDDLINHPQIRLMTIRTSEGEMEIMTPGALVDGQIYAATDVPDLGQHTDAIRHEFKQD